MYQTPTQTDGADNQPMYKKKYIRHLNLNTFDNLYVKVT